MILKYTIYKENVYLQVGELQNLKYTAVVVSKNIYVEFLSRAGFCAV